MKISTNLFFIFAFVIGIFFKADLAAQDNESNEETSPVVFAESEFDFGTVLEGTIISYEFKLANNTADAVKITSVRTNCGCFAIGKWKEENPLSRKPA